MSNALINERSPYLKQHAQNPVDWLPWGEAAFEKARREDKPVFLSIGYSTCHWCHVMARESFENKALAEILNHYYVSVKVDREERPDIDSVYMKVCTALNGSGGWPLTVIMTPEQQPFFVGTYLPRESSGGRMGLRELLLLCGLLLRLPLLLLEVRLDAFLGQVVGEVGGAAPSLALGLAQRVVRLVAPAHGLLAGLLVHLARLVQLHAAQPKLLAELVHAGRRVAGLLDAVSQHALESARLELALTVRPSRPLRARLGTHHGEAHLSAQLVVLALDRGVVGAVRDGVARLQIVVRYGGVDVHAAALAVGVDRDPARGVGCHLLA